MSDSICGARLTAKYEIINNKIIKLLNYEIKKEHTIKNEEHNYNYNEQILNDLKYKGTIIIKRKCSNPIYFKRFLIVMCINENKFNLTAKQILVDFLSKYGNIKFKTDDISESYKAYIIKKYKLEIEVKELKDNIFNEHITPQIIANSVAAYIYNLNRRKCSLDEKLKSLEYLNENISQTLYISFTRHNITYNKKGYIYMTKSMEQNLIKNNNIHSHFFADCTYNVIPSQNKNFKLYILIAFNNDKQKTELCSIILISNENVETFDTIYQYLYSKYKFQPTKLTVDCQKSHIISIQKIYPNCYIIICYFHIIRRLVIHLPQIRSKNKEIKESAKNLLANMKILLFLPHTDIQKFFDLIKLKYYDSFPKFIKYFYKYFFKEFPLNKLYWNYYYANLASEGNDTLFFTNNVVESSNRTINKLFIGAIKNVSLFEYTINQFINLYENQHKKYISPQFSVTNAINYYVKNTNINSLITFKKLFSIYEDYAKFKNTKELLDNKENIYDEENIYIKELNNANTFNHYEIDYNTDSSVDSDEEINFNYNKFEINDNDGGDDDGNNNDNAGKNSENTYKNIKKIIM